MLRSSSITNLQDRKSNSFLSSFRSKRGETTTATTAATPRKHRPLSQSFSSINLNQKYNISLEKTSYSSTVRRERNGKDKENELTTKRSNTQSTSIPTTSHTGTTANSSTSSKGHSTSGTSSNSTPGHSRKLNTRSSAPNLKSSKRHSMLFSGNYNYNSVLGPMQGINSTPPIIDILPDEIAADKNNSYESSESSLDDSSHSPYTPDDFHSMLDPLMDQSPIIIDTDFEFDYIPENESSYLYEKQHHHTLSTGSTASSFSRRRINAQESGLGDIIKLIDDDENSARLPINNRKSLEYENLERIKIMETLQRVNKDNGVLADSYVTTVRLISNAVFVGIEEKGNQNNTGAQIHHDEYMSVLMEESYENNSEDFYMDL
ncbi:hypothetical protein CLIB1423_07S02212 [[Candida] railenensis]|uniref:Uncharacterized protein n=1 Tax=[Candida] railenensis TaxID=45579 RepID=A0A9P0VYI8_9ASCO|nr:hypothetical protein CLIB1423_07S02212 [[Candida] railenensis]